MIILGITGPTGAGKTTVSKLFQKKGIKVVDGDILARKIVEPNKPALFELKNAFGEDIINKDGTLNRKKTAELVFSDPEKLAVLNRITHRYITEEFLKIASEYNGDIIGFDGAAILDSDFKNICNKILSVVADEEIRLKRIILRDNLTHDEARLRISGQKNNQFYIENSDFLVYNNGEDIEEDVNSIIEKLRSMI